MAQIKTDDLYDGAELLQFETLPPLVRDSGIPKEVMK